MGGALTTSEPPCAVFYSDYLIYSSTYFVPFVLLLSSHFRLGYRVSERG